jgi:hypothetical protein
MTDSPESQDRPSLNHRSTKTKKTADTADAARPRKPREIVLRCMVKHTIILTRSEFDEGGQPVRDRNGGRVVKTLTLGGTIDEGAKGKAQPTVRLLRNEWLKFRRDPAAGAAIRGLKQTGALLVLNG